MNEAISCWSERDRLHRVAVCRPATLPVASAEEARAVGFREAVTVAEAEDAYFSLRQALGMHHCQVIELSEFLTLDQRATSERIVNRVFVRDTAAVLGDNLVLGTAAFAARSAEFDLAGSALLALAGAAAAEDAVAVPVEFGDSFLLDPQTVLVNFGMRSDKSRCQQFIQAAWDCGFQEVVAVSIPDDVGLIHLDLAFNLLGADAVLARAFLRHLPLRRHRQGRQTDWIAFEDYFARRRQHVTWFEPVRHDDFLANFIYLDERLVLASATVAQRLRPIAAAAGIEVASAEIEALERGNGSIRCLTLPLHRGAAAATPAAPFAAAISGTAGISSLLSKELP
jgi:arginine deiminase